MTALVLNDQNVASPVVEVAGFEYSGPALVAAHLARE